MGRDGTLGQLAKRNEAKPLARPSPSRWRGGRWRWSPIPAPAVGPGARDSVPAAPRSPDTSLRHGTHRLPPGMARSSRPGAASRYPLGKGRKRLRRGHFRAPTRLQVPWERSPARRTRELAPTATAGHVPGFGGGGADLTTGRSPPRGRGEPRGPHRPRMAPAQWCPAPQGPRGL